MKKYNLSLAAAVAIIPAMFAFNASASNLCPGNTDEVCNITVNTDKVIDIDGIGDIDLSGVDVIAPDTEISIELPANVNAAIEFKQKNTGDVTNTVNYYGDALTGEFDFNANSIANIATYEAQVDGATVAIEAGQKNYGDVIVSSNVTLDRMQELETIDINVNAIGNSMTASNPGDTIVDFAQINDAGDVSATLNANFYAVRETISGTDTNINVNAIANTFSLESDGNVIASLAQVNHANVSTNVNIVMDGLRDPINVNAIGNSINLSGIDAGTSN